MLNPYIECKNISLTLPNESGEVNILKSINILIGKGETIGIVGPSGSGKTSLLMVISGLEKPTTGNIILNSQDITNLSEDELARIRGKDIGIVFQSFHLIPSMTALENVSLPLELQKNPDARDFAREELNKLKLSHRLNHYPSELSGGEQQRVALARAFVTEPKLLLADEPTGNLDHENGELVMEFLFKLHRDYETTLILVTHDLNMTSRCGRILNIEDGRIVKDSLKVAA